MIGRRLQQRQAFINARKFEDEYIKNKSIRDNAKNFNLPSLQKLGFKLINKSPVHKKLMDTLYTTNSNRFTENSEGGKVILY